MRSVFITFFMSSLIGWFPVANATSTEPGVEIEHLLHAIGQSDCVFTRNGTHHSATEAEDHLRMKYDRTRSRIKTAEAFIDHLASKSSWTRKPYSIQCTDGAPEPSRQWLYRELSQFRQT